MGDLGLRCQWRQKAEGRSLARLPKNSTSNSLGTMPATEPLSYPAASPDKSQASLTVRANFGDTPMPLDASTWDYTDSTLTAIKLNGKKFGDPSVFGPSGLYEFSYTAVNPKVAALGLAAIRDLAAFFRDAKTDDYGNKNPLAGNVKFIYTFCSSQPCRTMRDFVYSRLQPGRPR